MSASNNLCRGLFCLAAALCCTVFGQPVAFGQPAGLSAASQAETRGIKRAVRSAVSKANASVVAIARIPKDRVAYSQIEQLQTGSSPVDALEEPPVSTDFFGTGVVLSSDGLIATCAHVLGDPRENDYFVWHCSVVGSDVVGGETVRGITGHAAAVLGSDPFSDLAVLQVDVQGLVPIEVGRGAELQKEQIVVALGNPDSLASDGVPQSNWGRVASLRRFAPEGSASQSGAQRSIHAFGTLVQTDASIPLVASGGALVDLDGKLVGLTTSLTTTRGDGRPAGFAIAADTLFQRVLDSLSRGRLPEYGFLGIQPEDLPAPIRESGGRGALVRNVLPGMPGEKAGLRSNDVILKVGRVDINTRNDLFRELSRAGVGGSVALVVGRLGHPEQQRTLEASLSKKPVASPGLAYAINAPKPWRGMLVDYVTALPPELLLAGFGAQSFGVANVAVFDVDPNSAVWRAGIRPGDLILSMNGRELDSPEEFRAAVTILDGDVEMKVIRSNGAEQIVLIVGT